MIKLTNRGHAVLGIIEQLSEHDIRLLGYIANEKAAIEKSVKGMEHIGYGKEHLWRLQTLGFIKGV